MVGGSFWWVDARLRGNGIDTPPRDAKDGFASEHRGLTRVSGAIESKGL